VESGDDGSREVLGIVKTFSKGTLRKGVAEGGRLDMSSPEEKAARKAYIKAHGHPPPLTPDSVVAKYNPGDDIKVRDYYLRRKGIPQDKLDKMKEDGVAEASRGFRGVGGAREREDDERYDLDPSDWYIVKDGKLLKASIYPRQEAQARAEGFSPTREQARARASNKGVAEAGPGDVNRLEHRGEEYNVYFNQRKGMYTARGKGQMSGQIQPEWFHTLADAQDHAEMEIGGYDEHDGVTEGLKEDATGGSTGSSSVSAVVTELGAGGMTKQQLRKRQADYTNVRKAGGPVKVKRNG
jgi:hypothetical protein